LLRTIIIKRMRPAHIFAARTKHGAAVVAVLFLWGCQTEVTHKTPKIGESQAAREPTEQVATPKPKSPVSANAEQPQEMTHPNLAVAAQLVASGSFLDAEIVLTAILRDQPSSAQAKFLLGVVFLKTQRAARALPLLQASLASGQAFSGRNHVEHFIGWANYQLGELDAAKRAFQSHVAEVPTADDSYYGLAVIALDEDRVADAQQALERALELVGSSPRRARDRAKMLARLGDIEFRADRIEPAVDLFEQSLELYADHVEVWGKLARALDRLGRADAAEAARVKQAAAQARVDARGRGEAE
jgi:tetratricopeptide (TPR) repeat protein